MHDSLTQALPEQDIDLLVVASFCNNLDEVLVGQFLGSGLPLLAHDEVPFKQNVIIDDEDRRRRAVEVWRDDLLALIRFRSSTTCRNGEVNSELVIIVHIVRCTQ